MAIVHLNLEDEEDGSIRFQACFEGGFDVKSHAHQHAQLLIKLMDEIAHRNGQADVTVTEPAKTAAEVGFAEGDDLAELRRMASAGRALIRRS